MNDIKIVSGFGDKHWGTAIYVDDKLFSDDSYDSDYPDEDSSVMKLLKKLVKDYKINWSEITTHPCYRLSFYYSEVPKTWKKYEDIIMQFYNAHQTYASVEEFVPNHYFPQYDDNEKHAVFKVFELNGGTNFEQFYTQYLEQFSSIFEHPTCKQYNLSKISLENKKNPTTNEKHDSDNLYKELKEVWNKRLEAVWNAPKEYEPYKVQWLTKKTNTKAKTKLTVIK
jgi:hypothetical protein